MSKKIKIIKLTFYILSITRLKRAALYILNLNPKLKKRLRALYYRSNDQALSAENFIKHGYSADFQYKRALFQNGNVINDDLFIKNNPTLNYYRICEVILNYKNLI